MNEKLEMMLENKFHNDFLIVECDGPNDCYKEIVSAINENGQEVTSRGMKTKEARPAIFIFENPRERFLTCPGRKIHPFFQVMESIWILAGRGDTDWICKYIKNLEKYADNQSEFHAPYGYRMRHYGYYRDPNKKLSSIDPFMDDQFENCYQYLKSDLETRHACMSFWNPLFDNYLIKTNDRPCNIFFQFLVRQGKLDLTIFNRSNDVHWGLFNTNIVQFSVILEFMSLLLKIEMGKQIHISNSVHIYLNDESYLLTKDIISNSNDFNVYDYIKPAPFFYEYLSHYNFDLHIMDSDLRTFFDYEKEIWEKGGFIGRPYLIGVNYLKDALYMAEAYVQLKKFRDDQEKSAILGALSSLASLEADDLFVSCMEYVARFVSTGSEFFLRAHRLIEQRFEKISSEGREKIWNYIISH